MSRQQILRSMVYGAGLSAVVMAGACAPAEETPPPPAVQSEVLHHTERPMTVSGCLKMGEAGDTYVLTAAQADDGGETATYQLVPSPDVDLVDLKDQVGQEVRVSGTLRARQAATAQTLAEPAETDDDRAVAPSDAPGEPMVQTRTDVMINQLTVDSVTPLGEECGIGM